MQQFLIFGTIIKNYAQWGRGAGRFLKRTYTMHLENIWSSIFPILCFKSCPLPNFFTSPFPSQNSQIVSECPILESTLSVSFPNTYLNTYDVSGTVGETNSILISWSLHFSGNKKIMNR